jgi:hypothetical protein
MIFEFSMAFPYHIFTEEKMLLFIAAFIFKKVTGNFSKETPFRGCSHQNELLKSTYREIVLATS